MYRLIRPVLCLGSATISLVLAGCGTIGLRPGGFTTVVIDAGHGGKDSGESPNQYVREKDMALDTARRLQPILQSNGLHTVMTRTGDYFVELNDRVAIADRYYPNAILVSIHYNASPNHFPRGAQTFFWRGDSYGLATRVQRHLVGETDLDNRGITRRVLRLTHSPRVPSILVEGGFLTNRDEANLINAPAFRQRIAQGIADGILEEQEQGDVNIGTLPPLEHRVVPRPSREHHTGRSHQARMSRVHSRSKAKSKRKAKSTGSTSRTKRRKRG